MAHRHHLEFQERGQGEAGRAWGCGNGVERGGEAHNQQAHAQLNSTLKPSHSPTLSWQVYGSPALDAAWAEVEKGGDNPLPAVVAELRGVDVPPRMQLNAAGKATRGGGKKKQP